MSSDQIQPEPDLQAPREASYGAVTGRAWVKRELEFWHPCTVEHTDASGITVITDNMEELTVSHDRVRQFILGPGDLVFCHQWQGGLGGVPGIVVSAQNEAVELEYAKELFGQAIRYMHPLREICFYDKLKPGEWEIGERVFAYIPTNFNPELFLLFPGRVHAVHFEVCVEVEFDHRGNVIVPTTLVEKLELSVGDIVHACTSVQDQLVQSVESWMPCRILKLQDDDLILQDALGEVFKSTIRQIAVLPKHHQMIDGKFERFPGNSAGVTGRSALAIKMMHATHIVRSDHWLDAADDPITKSEVESLIAADPELAWSTESWADMEGDGEVTRYPAILWRGEPTFWWGGIAATFVVRTRRRRSWRR